MLASFLEEVQNSFSRKLVAGLSDFLRRKFAYAVGGLQRLQSLLQQKRTTSFSKHFFAPLDASIKKRALLKAPLKSHLKIFSRRFGRREICEGQLAL